MKPNYNEVSLLISEYNSSVFCFQKTFLKPDDNISLKGFNIYNYVHIDCLRPSDGASIFVKSSFPQRKIDLQTELQATAVSVTLDKEITICSVYIPPSISLNSKHLDNLLQQLPSPYIILGDFYHIGSDLKTYLLMRWWRPDALPVSRGLPGFTCWISFAPVFSFIYC